MSEGTFYIDPDSIVDDARRTVIDIINDEGFLRESYVEEMIAQATRERDGGEVLTTNSAPTWVRGQLESMPRAYGDRCVLGKAFTTAVLHVLNDVIAEATPDGQDAMRKLLGVVDAHQAAAQPQGDEAATLAAPEAPEREYVLVLNSGVRTADGHYRDLEGAVGPFDSYDGLMAWVTRTGRHGTIRLIERP